MPVLKQCNASVRVKFQHTQLRYIFKIFIYYFDLRACLAMESTASKLIEHFTGRKYTCMCGSSLFIKWTNYTCTHKLYMVNDHVHTSAQPHMYGTKRNQYTYMYMYGDWLQPHINIVWSCGQNIAENSPYMHLQYAYKMLINTVDPLHNYR